MQFRRHILCPAILALAAGSTIAALPATAQQTTQQPTDVSTTPVPLIKTQTRLVLVDTVVTDKKGNPVRDLTAKDFKLWEDNKEQNITSFSFEDENAAPANAQRRYLVLFFDNSTMDTSDQARARDAAAKFIDANSGPNHLMAIVDFGGTVQIAQNFTADANRLKQVVSGVKMSAVNPNAQSPVEVASLGTPPIGGGVPNLSNAEADFGIQSVMLALRSLARNLSTVPGRKSLVLLTSGFPLTSEHTSELTAVIDACNKANVAIYPIDVRGLVATAPGGARLHLPAHAHTAQLTPAALRYSGNPGMPHAHLLLASALVAEPVQHGGGGGGGGGGSSTVGGGDGVDGASVVIGRRREQ